MTVRTLASSAWTWAIVALPLAAPLAAQRGAARRELPRPSREASGGARRAQAIRAEYAAVLLQSGQYRAAAQEYRTLLASEPHHADYRFALARALAWGGEPREAERELRALRTQRPNDPQVAALLRTTRESYEPTAQEAEQWVAEDASFAPYRLAFARALAREGDWARGIRLLRDALARTPADTASRHALAVILTGAGALDEAVVQYDTLLASRGGASDVTLIASLTATRSEQLTRASLWLERAQVNVARGDLGAAESDVQSSISATPTADAFVLLGDLARWRGQYAMARSWYERAQGLQSDSRAVRAAFGRLARDEHPALAFAPVENSSEGWRADASAIGDNLGVRYATASTHRGTLLPGGITASAGVEYRQLSENSSLRSVALDGYAAEVAASRESQLGVFYSRVGAHGGFVSHPGLGAFPEGSVSLAGWYGAWGLGLDLRSVLAYPSLLTLESLRPSQVETGSGRPFVIDQPLREQSTTASIAGPLARTDLALVAQRSHLSDGNVRTTVQLYARHPLAPRLAMIYAGSVIGFSDRSPLYWDPLSYVSNATGLEYAVRRARGFTYALSLLPGLASAEESLSGSVPRDMPREMRRSATQFSGAGDASYRTEAWEAGAAMSYSRGRAGSYERMGARLYLRLTP